jgi:hypothetical protein
LGAGAAAPYQISSTEFLPPNSEAGSFSSPGMAHPTKKMLRLSVPKNAVVDDVKIHRRG